MSIIVPVFNEEEALAGFLDRLNPALAATALAYEIIFVDDGSSDRTFDVLSTRARCTNTIKVVRLSRNFGKDIALTAGLDYAIGDIVIPIDVDLQDPPELIPEMVQLWWEGYDVVYGVRRRRHTDSAFKRGSAAAFYRVFNALSDIKIAPHAGDFRLLDRRVVNALGVLPERNRFMKGLYSWVGFRQTAVEFDREKRESGISRWRPFGLLGYALDGIAAFSSAMLNVWSYIGFMIAALALIYGLFIVVYTIWNGVSVPGYASLISSIAFIGGLQLGVMGILGQYIGRIFVETKARPLYLVSTIEGFEKPLQQAQKTTTDTTDKAEM